MTARAHSAEFITPEELTTMLRRLLSENVELSCDLPADLPMIRADQTCVEQVVLNLVLNARDAMSKGGRIVISTGPVHVDAADRLAEPGAHSGEYVCLRVRDTGCGMNEEIRTRILEPFFTTKEVSKGTGGHFRSIPASSPVTLRGLVS